MGLTRFSKNPSGQIFVYYTLEKIPVLKSQD